MALLFVVLAMLFGRLLTNIAKWSPRRRRSMERYHRALEVLGGLSEHHQDAAATEEEPRPVPERATPDQSARPTIPQRAVAAPLPETERPTLIFVDDSLSGDTAGEISRGKPRQHVAARYRPVLVGGAVLVAALGTILGLVASRSTPTRPGAAQNPATTPTTTPRSGTATRGSTPAHPASSTTTTTTTTTVPLTTGGLVITSVSPSVAQGGGTVTITGGGFVGPNGIVFATFNGQPAPTRCPSEHECIATVPAGLTATVVVRLQTTNHKSNGISLTYRA